MPAIVNPTDKIVITDDVLRELLQNISVQQNGANFKNFEYTESSEDGGENILTIHFIDNSIEPLELKIKNGSKGEQGEPGEAAVISSISASIPSDDTPGEPTIEVSSSGDYTNKSFSFTFQHLKGVQGEKGEQGNEGPQGPQGPRGEAGPIGPQGIQGPAGERGPAGPAGPQGNEGPQGSTGNRGPTGYYFTPKVSTDGILSWSNNGSLDNPASINIKGPQGPKGDKGDPGVNPFSLDEDLSYEPVE